MRTWIEQELEKEEFWKQILGGELWEKMKHSFSEVRSGVSDGERKEAREFWDFLADFKVERGWSRDWDKEIFGGFYGMIIAAFLQWKKAPNGGNIPLGRAGKAMERILYESICAIPVRVCIGELRQLKEQGKLHGEGGEEEYAFYCREYLKNPEYVKGLCRQYPEMFRLLFVRMRDTCHYLEEFFRNFEEDKAGLEARFCGGRKIGEAAELTVGGSDRHGGGKTVIRVQLDNGIRVMYKPHSLKNEAAYQNIYETICGELEIPALHFGLWDRGTYGWETYLEKEACREEEQINRFFRRMGIHLFLGYLLGGTDIHQENMLAVGEFPMLLDAETIPGMRRKEEVHTAEERIHADLSESVLKTGILPVPVWKNEEESVILNAIYGAGGMKTSVKIPVIINERTSGMAIVNRQVELEKGDSMPFLGGTRIDASQFTVYLKDGFECAYRLWLKKQELFEPMLEDFWDCEVRYLVRHTQQYHMYLNSSLHPFFLRDAKRRLLMLQVLRKAGEEESLVQQEIEAMYQMDIPMFRIGAREIRLDCQKSAYESYRDIVRNMGEADLGRQEELIQIAMDMLNPEKRMNDYGANTNRNDYGRIRKQSEAVERIIEEVTGKAVIEGGDIGWMKLHMEGNSFWKMMPADLSFYDGIGGIAVFLAEARKNGFDVREGLLEKAVGKIFRYIENTEKKDRRTGLMIGEGSIAYTCLLLYRITGEKRFGEYAGKQAESLRQLYLLDEAYDLLTGNAGAILLLTEMYQEFGEEKWLQLAAEIGDYLWKRAEKQEKGYGWVCQKGGCALSGMAHGNSGFITAYAALLKYTHNRKYQGIIDELLEYENSLYSEHAGNWRDMRYPQQEVYGNAWCHGAAGILLARLRLVVLEEYKENKAVLRDIENAARVLFGQSERNGLCLCHGMAGNYWIMGEYAKCREMKEEYRKKRIELKQRMLDILFDERKMLPQDKYMLGMMTGMCGVGMSRFHTV